MNLQHDSLAIICVTTKGYHNSSCGLISREEIVIEEDTSVIALANILIFIKNKSKMTGNSTLMNQA